MKYNNLKINEDVVVPRSSVPELIRRVEEIGKKHDTFVANFGHAGDGNIHVNFMCDRHDPESVARARKAVKETFELSVQIRRHNQRRTRHRLRQKPIPRHRHRQTDFGIMKSIKKVFDPNGILNPGKMFV